MSHRNISALPSSPDSPQIKAFVHSGMERLGVSEQEFRRRAIEAYGSVERTMRADAENRAAIEKACPGGHINQAGRKPKPGEEVLFAQVREDLMIRVWGGDLASYSLYSFDFVNRERQYILTPDDVKIYAVETAFTPSARVRSMEDLVDMQDAKSFYSHATRKDPNWETYLIHEGTVLRITQQNHSDCFLHIPIRPNSSTLVLQPW